MALTFVAGNNSIIIAVAASNIAIARLIVFAIYYAALNVSLSLFKNKNIEIAVSPIHKNHLG